MSESDRPASPLGPFKPADQARILVVEDSWPERNRLKVILQRAGYHVLEANDAEIGLEVARTFRPDIVISDWVMPGMGGLEFCKTLRQQEQSHAHFMMLTCREAIADCIACMDAGADDFQSKPLNTGELKARIRAALRRRNATVQ